MTVEDLKTYFENAGVYNINDSKPGLSYSVFSPQKKGGKYKPEFFPTGANGKNSAWSNAEYVIIRIPADYPEISNESILKEWTTSVRADLPDQLIVLPDENNDWNVYNKSKENLGKITEHLSLVTIKHKTFLPSGAPIQAIYYGAPGTGKSYKVKHEIIPSGVDYYTVTFYSDYYYSDFVGGIRPVCTDKGIGYKFQPGPFARALKDSFTKPVFLVIEEINRGNAAAIFGDIFQLLDRKSGTSDYSITNHDLYKYLTEEGKISLPEDKIYLPSNLNIVCTMNTADQNVFVLDSAFKRRFKMEYVPIDFNAYYKDDVLQEGCKGYIEKCDIFNIGSFEADWKKVIPAHMHEEITTKVKEAGRNWPTFAAYVNAKIDEINSSEQKISEDKKLGPFFIDVEELDNIKAFVDKVIYYLKQDVFKYEDNILDESYETLYSKIISGKYDLFGILDLKK